MKRRLASSGLVVLVAFSSLSGLFSQADSQATQPQLDQSVLPDLISFRFSVVDSHGNFVTGLQKDAFTILENKAPQRIVSFSNMDSPLSVGIVFESGSLSGKSIQQAREAVVNFIRTTDPRNEFFALAFNSPSETRIESPRDADAILGALIEGQAKKATPLLDSVYLAAEKIQHSRYDRRLLLLITDGSENDSQYKMEDLRRILQQSGVMLYAIGIVEGVSLPSKRGFHIQTLLNDLSEPTGGRSFFPLSKAKLQEAFDKIALELHSQYSIGYKPDNVVRDAKWHNITIRVSPPSASEKLTVVGKTGHFALPRGH